GKEGGAVNDALGSWFFVVERIQESGVRSQNSEFRMGMRGSAILDGQRWLLLLTAEFWILNSLFPRGRN
ncbi:MAG: hypothetical protein H7831_18155, partial [Magnetococcus sp. WYHC-3]